MFARPVEAMNIAQRTRKKGYVLVCWGSSSWCAFFRPVVLVCGLRALPGASRVEVRGRVSRSGPSSWCELFGLHVVYVVRVLRHLQRRRLGNF
eukprot:7888420-Pyramimonas_sp.AAC.1